MMKIECLLASLLLATTFAVQAQFNYTVTNQTVTITKYAGTKLVVAIPSTITGLPVTSIGELAFYASGMTSVTIPSSVTNIGYNAFVDSSSLTNIMVDPLNSAYSGVDGVLFNQNQTTLVQYPGGKVGDYMIPNTVINIGDFAFGECTNLSSVTIPNSVTSIGDFAFYASGLTSVTIPSSVTNIGYDAFVVGTSLTNIMVDPLNSAYSGVDGVLFKTRQHLCNIPAVRLGTT